MSLNNNSKMDDLSPLNDENRTKVREKLSTMSFEDLLELKKTIGTKLLNESVLGNSTKKQNISFKRANKNRPREMSSKKKLSLQPSNIISTVRSQPRDPRFDSLCGTYDDKIFKQNYKFIFNIKMKEMKQLQNELQNEEDPNRIIKIKKLIQRLKNQIREHKRQEAESSEINDAVNKGSNPIFKKKSEEKLEQIMQKYAKLKSSNSMKKYMERKSKKLKKREQKQLLHHD